MTDLEISKALALAIGWKPEQMRSYDLSQTLYCPCAESEGHSGAGIRFDYRDWAVIGPIAERYKAFPKAVLKNEWCSILPREGPVYADTPQKAIALAVIKGAKK